MESKVSRVPAFVSIVFLLLAGLGGWPFGFYTILRFVVCGSAVYLAVEASALKKKGWMWVMGGMAFLFNPLSPVHSSRSSLRILDLVAAAIFAVSLAAIHSRSKVGQPQ